MSHVLMEGLFEHEKNIARLSKVEACAQSLKEITNMEQVYRIADPYSVKEGELRVIVTNQRTSVKMSQTYLFQVFDIASTRAIFVSP